MKRRTHGQRKFSSILVFGLGGLILNVACAQSWTTTSIPFTGWDAAACSADGSKLVATGGRLCGYFCGDLMPVYVSADSGATWLQSGASSNWWASVASSADGARLFAAASRPWAADGIFCSSDSGATWYLTSAPS